MSAASSQVAAAAVEVHDLGVSIQGTKIPVVADISFRIPPGEILGLVGESGSGKTTAGLALMAYAKRGLEITSGSVRIGTLDMLSLDESDAKRARGRVVSYVPQDPVTSLNPVQRVGTQLREALEVHTKDLEGLDIDERIAQVLEDVALPSEILDSFPHQMSGGQQQRIGIAMAFACRPRLIVLDEPTTGLDVSTQRHILETIRKLSCSYGVTCVYVSHDLAVVGQIASSTAVMYAGRIVELGDTDRLFVEPQHPYTAGLLAAVPIPEEARKLVGIEGHPPRPGRWPKGCAFGNRCSLADEACTAGVSVFERAGSGRFVCCVHPLPKGRGAATAGESAPVPRGGTRVGLEVRELNASYGDKPVLHSVSFDVEPGMVTAVVGESGSGKTTLAYCLSGLHSRWTGEIRLGGTPLATAAAHRSDNQRRLMQYIFQSPYASLNPTMTVMENIEEPLRYFERRISRSERRQRAMDALRSVALSEEFADLLPRRLSGGERQRAAVARALVVEPDILVCDEITSALDVSVQALLIERLRDLQLQRELSMVFITHNLALVRSLAQHAIVLQRGTVVEQGPIDQVLDDPQHEYTQQLLADIPKMNTCQLV